jgi:hypothetical protein
MWILGFLSEEDCIPKIKHFSRLNTITNQAKGFWDLTIKEWSS